MMTATITHHSISFFRNTRTSIVRAECSCGWNAEGKAVDVYGRAACHDLDIEAKPDPEVERLRYLAP